MDTFTIGPAAREAGVGVEMIRFRRRALAKIEEVDTRVAQLAEIRSALVRLLAACPGSGALGACSILEALHASELTGSGTIARRPERVRKRGHMKDATFRIEGMHCDGCAKTIEALVGAESGVERAAVSFGAREARVRFDPSAIDDARIIAAIERAGYKILAGGR